MNFWTYFLIGIGVVIIIGIVSVIRENQKNIQEELERREREKKAELEKEKSLFTTEVCKLNGEITAFKKTGDYATNTVLGVFSGQYYYEQAYKHIIDLVKQMEHNIARMKDILAVMKSANLSIIRLNPEEDRKNIIDEYVTRIDLKECKPTVANLKNVAEKLKAFGEKRRNVSYCKMMDRSDYGRIKKDYWDSVRSCNRVDVLKYIFECQRKLNSTQFDEIFELDYEDVLDAVWFFATESPFSASDFRNAVDVFNRIYKMSHHDIFIADLYSKKKVGGEEVLREPIRELLNNENTAYKYTLRIIASSLMWMNAYRLETDVLQHMLTNGMEMDAKIQQRLHSLTNGGGNAPEGFDVDSSAKTFYFDLSALAWKEDEYVGLFENLAFKDKTLTYSLAVREETKDLIVPNGINVSDRNYVVDRFNVEFEEEYGADVIAQIADCTALSGSGEEKIDGIVVTSNECKQMSILIHIAKIGKKLNIKFYTLFVPDGDDMAVQKQQALSMYNRLSPTVTMWETSLKDTMLRSIEQILNSGGTSEGANTELGIDKSTIVF